MGRRPPVLTALEKEFQERLRLQGKTTSTRKHYMNYIHRFMRYVGGEPLHRLTGEQMKYFFEQEFGHWGKSTQVIASAVVTQFVRFAVAQSLPVPVVVNRRESKAAPAPVLDPVRDAREIALRQKWSFDRLLLEKEKGDDLIAALGRQLVNHYLFFQSLLSQTPLNLDEVIRLADECRETIDSNLSLFLKLSALGKNLGPKINERIIR